MNLNLPNKITLIRIFLIPIFVAVFFIDALGLMRFLIAAIIFAIAAATDAVDGHIARSRGLVTNLGKFLDPIADKVLITTAMILLLAAKWPIFSVFGELANGCYIATTVCVCIITARELIISAFRQIAASTGFIMAADKLGKVKATVQDVSIVFFFVGAAFLTSLFGEILLWIALGLFLLATVLTILSGISYVVKNSQVLKDAD